MPTELEIILKIEIKGVMETILGELTVQSDHTVSIAGESSQ